MKFYSIDNILLFVFIVFCFVMFGAFVSLMRLTTNWKKWSLAYLILILIISISSATVYAHSFFIFFSLFLSTLFAVFFTFTKSGLEVVNGVSLSFLIGAQGFRLPLAILFYFLAKIDAAPEAMTWTGQNWDLITGILSFASIPLIKRSKALAIVINFIGFLLLLNIFRLVILLSLFSISWNIESPLLLMSNFPYVLFIPLFLLPALVLHLITFRKL